MAPQRLARGLGQQRHAVTVAFAGSHDELPTIDRRIQPT
jgi:hypothetical protein